MFGPVRIAPSILSGNFMDLGRDIALIEEAGAGYVHFDVMDGHFVPNLTIGIPVLKQLARQATIPVDVHLMIANPLVQLPWFLDACAGAAAGMEENVFSMHAEALADEDEGFRAIELIHEAGALAGLALKPGTPADAAAPFLSHLDLVLPMSVEPGFSGQSYIAGTEEKVAQIAELARQAGVSPLIEVDGGMGLSTVGLVASQGADVIVCGNAVFKAEDPARAIRDIAAAGNASRRLS